jgi:hypothetical protein
LKPEKILFSGSGSGFKPEPELENQKKMYDLVQDFSPGAIISVYD